MAECPWPIDIDTCCREVNIDPADPESAALVADVIAQASTMLSRWSGFLYGGCRTVRPLEPCGECRSGCCSQGDCIVLHEVSSVAEVRLDGDVVDPGDYHFDPARGVLCAVPPMRWPNADPRSSATPAMEVDVMVGVAPDAWALRVGATLACELLRSCAEDEDCRLPRNATMVSAQGVTITLGDDEMKYALPEVISWVETVNPARATSPALVLSPEVDRARVAGRGRWGGRGRWDW